MLTKDEAIQFAETKQWEPMSLKERAIFQWNQECLCMPFDKFHEAFEALLGRPVWTHEFAFREELQKEISGLKEKPSLDEIIDLLPKEKTIIVGTE